MLRWREVGTGRSFGIEPWLATPAAKDRILEAWETMRPLSEWLTANVPASE